MMNDTTIEIRCEHFETNAPSTFKKLWNDHDFADVTLATLDHHQIRAHKVILSYCSKFFRDIFLKNPHQNPLLYLKGIRYKELAMVIKLIYLGQCEVGQNELKDFLTTGNDLEVEGLIENTNLINIKGSIDENGTQNTQEPRESDSNYTDIDDTTWEMSPQKNEREVILPFNQQDDDRFFCNNCNEGFDSHWSHLVHKQAKHEGVWYE